MRPSTLARLSGLALLTGALVGAVAMAIHPDSPRDPLDGPLHTLYLPAILLVLLGLSALLARLAERAGPLGLVGGLALWFGLAVAEVPHAAISATALPALLANPSTNALVSEDSIAFANLMAGPWGVMLPIAEALLAIGALAIPAAVLRSGAFPRWPALALLAALLVSVLSMVTPVVPGNIGPVLVFVGLAGMGLTLLFELGPERLPIRRRTFAASAQA